MIHADHIQANSCSQSVTRPDAQRLCGAVSTMRCPWCWTTALHPPCPNVQDTLEDTSDRLQTRPVHLTGAVTDRSQMLCTVAACYLGNLKRVGEGICVVHRSVVGHCCCCWYWKSLSLSLSYTHSLTLTRARARNNWRQLTAKPSLQVKCGAYRAAE